MSNKQLAMLIASMAFLALGAAYYSTLTPYQQCFTQECREREQMAELDAEIEKLDRDLERAREESREHQRKMCRDFNICF